ncbi:hypothetical protein [Paracoccus sp. SY]|uniref:hypothetical protein n=1 Tax=Paracoccus sp. SY TaxID=1330255 RepID=UPI001EFD4721|nr:hypothetical protein [Paracoccus sp. SY]
MTTPPKVRRYHASAAESVRPSAQDGAQPSADAKIRVTVRKRVANTAQDDERERLMRTDPVDDGLSHVGPAPAEDKASDGDLDAQLALIRKENLSDRQLRIARRIAALHQIEAASTRKPCCACANAGSTPRIAQP